MALLSSRAVTTVHRELHSHRLPLGSNFNIGLQRCSMQDELILPNELIDLSNAITRIPESLTSGSNDTRTAALTATKFVFDIGNLSFGRHQS